MHAAFTMLPTAGIGAARAMMPLAPGHGSQKRPDKLMLKAFLGSRMPAPVPIQHAHAWSPLTICAAATSAPAQEISAKPMNIVFVSAEVCVPTSPSGQSLSTCPAEAVTHRQPVQAGRGAVSPLSSTDQRICHAARLLFNLLWPACCSKRHRVQVAPWSKTGGLGDVVGGLPIELAKRGHRASLALSSRNL